MTVTSTYFHAHVDGFSTDVKTVADIQEWIDGLKARFNLSGHVLTIWKIGEDMLAKQVFEGEVS